MLCFDRIPSWTSAERLSCLVLSRLVSFLFSPLFPVESFIAMCTVVWGSLCTLSLAKGVWGSGEEVAALSTKNSPACLPRQTGQHAEGH